MFYKSKELVTLNDHVRYLNKHPEIEFEMSILLNKEFTVQVRTKKFNQNEKVQIEEDELIFVFYWKSKNICEIFSSCSFGKELIYLNAEGYFYQIYLKTKREVKNIHSIINEVFDDIYKPIASDTYYIDLNIIDLKGSMIKMKYDRVLFWH
jgi:hypothetical protein